MRTIKITREYDNGHSITFDMAVEGSAIVTIDDQPHSPSQINIELSDSKTKMDILMRRRFPQTSMNLINEIEILQQEDWGQEINYGTTIEVYRNNGHIQQYILNCTGKSITHSGYINSLNWSLELWQEWKNSQITRYS